MKEYIAMSTICTVFLCFQRAKVNTDLSHPPWSEHTLRLVVNPVNERILTVGEEDQGEIVLGCQDGGGVVEDAVGVPRLYATPTQHILDSGILMHSFPFESIVR